MPILNRIGNIQNDHVLARNQSFLIGIDYLWCRDSGLTPKMGFTPQNRILLDFSAIIAGFSDATQLHCGIRHGTKSAKM
jgi:hypothetical protein